MSLTHNIHEWKDKNDFSLRQLNHLLHQLGSEIEPITEDHLTQLLSSKSSKLFVMLDSDQNIVGSISIILFAIPTGLRCWIEDVVVDERNRGQNLGLQLMQFAIEYAKAHSYKNINLTSRPERIAANKLYQKMGFELRNTNAYRLLING